MVASIFSALEATAPDAPPELASSIYTYRARCTGVPASRPSRPSAFGIAWCGRRRELTNCCALRPSLAHCPPQLKTYRPVPQLGLPHTKHLGPHGFNACLTRRSSGAPTAGHQARSGGTRYIFASPGLASCRWSRLSSNVRHLNTNSSKFRGFVQQSLCSTPALRTHLHEIVPTARSC